MIPSWKRLALRERLCRMMQRRLFAGLYHRSKFRVASRARAMSLESSSPIRSLRVASRDESGERSKRCQTKGQRCPCAVMIDWKLGVASRSMRERIVRTLEKRSITRHPPQVRRRGEGERRVPNESQSERAYFRLIRSTSAGDGGLAWARFRAEDINVEATERDPRLHGRV